MIFLSFVSKHWYSGDKFYYDVLDGWHCKINIYSSNIKIGTYANCYEYNIFTNEAEVV
jgi:hypothetical protein